MPAFDIAKLDDAQLMAFGFASVAITRDGESLEDTQGDEIPADELEQAAYDYVLNSREADAMHDEKPIGRLVESMVFTPEKLTALGLAADAIQPRWWVGFKLSKDAYAAVKSGKYTMFSIGATAERVPNAAAA